MSRNAFNQSERDYNRAEEMREHTAMERKTSISDTAIYQQTAQLAEKYKAQRDELLEVAKESLGVVRTLSHPRLGRGTLIRLQKVITEVEQSL